MKNLKKLLAVLVVISMVSTLMVSAFGATFTYETQAKNLYDLGLYKGTDPESYVPNLEGRLDRQTGVVMLLRLFGQEEDSLALTEEQANAKLTGFSDVASIEVWAKKQVAYAVDKGYVKGYPDGTFQPANDLNGKAFSSLILQQLGYDGDFDYSTAAFYLNQVGGLTDAEAATFNSDAGIIRDAMVGIAYGAMRANYKASEQTVAEKLVELGKIDEKLAIEVNLIDRKVKEVAVLEDVRVIIGGTPVLPTTVQITYEDDTTGQGNIEWPSVDTSASGEKAIEGKITGTNAVAKVKVIVEEDKLKAVKISNTNLKEVFVDFNKAVDEDSAKDKGNYEIADRGWEDGDKIELEDNGRTVKIIFSPALSNGTDLEITVSGVEDASGNEMKDDSVLKATIKDVTFPTAESISLTGPDTFKVKFSEPMDASVSGAEVEFDDGVYNVDFDEDSDSDEIIFTLGVSELEEGDYKVVIKGFKDFAGYLAFDKEFTLKYAKDNSELKGEVTEADQTEVKIKFSKGVVDEDDVALTKEFFYQTYSSQNPDEVEVNADKTEYTLTFTSYPLYEGNVKIVVNNKVDDVKVKDVWGNELTSQMALTAKVVADNTKPTVKKVESGDEENIVKVHFSENVKQDDAEDEDNYLFKDSKGNEVSISSIDYTADKDKKEYYVTVKFSEDLSGTYTVEIKNIKDESLNENEMAKVTKTFEVEDNSAIDTSKVEVYAVDGGEGVNNDYIYITYPEDMDRDSVLNKNMYLIKNKNTGVTKKLEDKDKVEIFRNDKAKVRITINDKKTYVLEDEIYDLMIGQVKDAAGNKIDEFSFAVPIEADIPPVVTEVKTTGERSLEVKVDRVLVTIPSDSILVGETVAGATYKPAKIAFEVDDGKTTIKLTLRANEKLSSPADTNIAVAIVGGKIKSETNKYMEEITIAPSAVKDGYAPSLDGDLKQVGATEFTVTFDEELKFSGSQLDMFAAELEITDKDGDKLVANEDYVLSASGKVVTVELIGDDYEDYTGRLRVSTKSKVNYAKDAEGNKINSFTNKSVDIK